MTTNIGNAITTIVQYPIEFIMCKTGGPDGQKTFTHLKENLPKALKILSALFYAIVVNSALVSLCAQPIQIGATLGLTSFLAFYSAILLISKVCETYHRAMYAAQN